MEQKPRSDSQGGMSFEIRSGQPNSLEYMTEAYHLRETIGYELEDGKYRFADYKDGKYDSCNRSSSSELDESDEGWVFGVDILPDEQKVVIIPEDKSKKQNKVESDNDLEIRTKNPLKFNEETIEKIRKKFEQYVLGYTIFHEKARAKNEDKDDDWRKDNLEAFRYQDSVMFLSKEAIKKMRAIDGENDIKDIKPADCFTEKIRSIAPQVTFSIDIRKVPRFLMSGFPFTGEIPKSTIEILKDTDKRKWEGYLNNKAVRGFIAIMDIIMNKFIKADKSKKKDNTVGKKSFFLNPRMSLKDYAKRVVEYVKNKTGESEDKVKENLRTIGKKHWGKEGQKYGNEPGYTKIQLYNSLLDGGDLIDKAYHRGDTHSIKDVDLGDPEPTYRVHFELRGISMYGSSKKSKKGQVIQEHYTLFEAAAICEYIFAWLKEFHFPDKPGTKEVNVQSVTTIMEHYQQYYNNEDLKNIPTKLNSHP